MQVDLAPINILHQSGAPDFVDTDASSILAALKSKFEDFTGRTLSPSEVEMYLFETAAYLFAIKNTQVQIALENNFVAFADDTFLEILGADRNTPRLDPQPAVTKIQFSTTEPALVGINIPVGTRVSDPSGQLVFLTVEPGTLAAGEISVTLDAEAKAQGVFANDLAPGAISNLVDAIAGISGAVNVTMSSGGASIENIDRYRARLPLAFELLGDGLSRERYVADVLNWDSRVVDVFVTRPERGHVHIFPLLTSGAPSAQDLESLANVFDASNTHQGDYIQAFPPAGHEFLVDLALKLSQPEALNPAIQAIQNVLIGWTQHLGGYIAPSELIEAAKSVPGVIDADTPNLAFLEIERGKWRHGLLGAVSHEVIQ